MDPVQNPPQSPVLPPPAQVQIESTEIPLSSLPPEHTSHPEIPFWKKKKFLIIMGGLFFFFFLIIIIAFFFRKPVPVKKSGPKPTPTPTPVVSTILPINTKNHSQILVSAVPHFADLKLSDLPNIYDIRGIFNYKKDLIIVSTSGIIEYNPKTNTIVRQNDPRVFNCINYGTVIANKLYVACNQQPPSVSVINLDTGKLEKTYTQGSAVLASVSVTSSGDTLWVGATNEVIRVNTKNDIMETYSPGILGLPVCKDFYVYSYNKTVWTTCGYDAKSGISIYDEVTNTWKSFIPTEAANEPLYTVGYTNNTIYFRTPIENSPLYTYHTDTKSWDISPSLSVRIPSSKPEAEEIRAQLQKDVIFPSLEQKGIAYLSYFDTVEKKVKDLELVISPYIGLSEIIDEKRYLFTHTAIDKVTATTFPKAFKKTNLPVGLGTKTFVDPFENYAVLIGSASAATPPFTAYLVEVKKGLVTDLMKDNDTLNDVEPESILQFSNNLDSNYRIAGTSKDAKVTNKATGDEVIKVDFETKELNFSD